jgi:hypothetical protein
VPDQIITPKLAAALHQRALELSDPPMWEITEDGPGLPGVLLARLITDRATPYVLIASSLEDLRAKLPPRLVRRDSQPAGSPAVMEVSGSET